MKVVIPYKLGPDDGLELRYAIRSLYKHFKGITGVALIGGVPSWFTGSFIQIAEPTAVKEYNMMLKVRMIAEPLFLYTNDDFFMLQDFDLDTLPFFYEKTCGARSNDFGYGPYKRMYEACPSDWYNFDVHCPMVMDSRIFESAFKKYVGKGNEEAALPIKTMYGNHALSVTKLIREGSDKFYAFERPVSYAVDQKIKGMYHYHELKNMIEGRPFFSTTEMNGTLNDPMIRLLNELYPDKSPVESF